MHPIAASRVDGFVNLGLAAAMHAYIPESKMIHCQDQKKLLSKRTIIFLIKKKEVISMLIQ